MINRAYLLSLRYITCFCISCLCLFHNALSGQNNFSPFESGPTYKLEISNTGLYKLDYNWFLSNTTETINSIDPRNIQLWTSDGTFEQIPLKISGESDGRFDPEDHLLFFMEGPKEKLQGYEQNPFDQSNYCFLIFGQEPGTRINLEINNLDPSNNLSKVKEEYTYDEDLYNLLDIDINNSGSGQNWVGKEISNNKSSDIKELLAPDLTSPSKLDIELSIIVRSDKSETINISLGAASYDMASSSVDIGDVEDLYGRRIRLKKTIDPATAQSDEWKINFIKNSSNARVWIDQIRLIVEDNLNLNPDANLISPVDLESNSNTIPVEHESLNEVWAINSTSQITELELKIQERDKVVQIINNDHLLIFNKNATHLQPSNIELIKVANLSNIENAELVILYYPNWANQAERLAAHRTDHSGTPTKTININDVYNNYSSGQKRPEAIRFFAKSLWEKSNDFKYLLLFGDGSYDYRGLSSDPFENFIPTYETTESLDPLLSFPTDDYFALLDEVNPNSLIGDLDIAIGRIPVRNVAEAEAVVTKLIHYDTHSSTLGEWKNNIAFLADDEDFNLHINDADKIANRTKDKYGLFNQSKIYWDAFPQVSTPGGNRYPDANRKLNETIDQGVLVMNYLGHGGPIGWSQERVLNIDDIESWTNFNRLPLIITATCSFTGFDDPQVTSAGEASLLNPVGGAIALFTTVRSVYASKNFRLTQAVYDTIFSTDNGINLPIGEILRRSKNVNVSDNTNARKFLLIGDPSMKLSLPKLGITTTMFNNNGDPNITMDTIGALDQVDLSGAVHLSNGELDTNFNGELIVTIFDKETQVATLKNDSRSLDKKFSVQNNIIYKGTAKIEKGKFETSFIVPVDINYIAGTGKISYYAISDKNEEASGSFENFIIAGSSADPIQDDEGPEITLYMDNRDFINGGTIAPNTILIADLSDDIGINLSQTSIGHEITAQIDGDTKNTIILNDFYDAVGDGIGTLRYPITNLSEGPHSITLKAFDIANNLGETTIEFTVDPQLSKLISNLQSNPNPSCGEIITFSFDHKLGDKSLEISVEIYSNQGQLIHTIKTQKTASLGKVENIIWDTISPNDERLPTSVYLYRVILDDGVNEKAYSDMKKLQIIKY